MRSSPSVQRLPFSTRIRGPRPRLRSRRRRHAAAATPFLVHFARFGFLGAVAALMVAGAAGREATCGCFDGRYVADVAPVQRGDAWNATDNDLPTEEPMDFMPSVAADPAAATGGGRGGGEQPVSPQPCPTYASPEAMAAAASS